MNRNIKLRLTRQQYAVLVSDFKSVKNSISIATCGVGFNITNNTQNISLSLCKSQNSNFSDSKIQNNENSQFLQFIQNFINNNLKKNQSIIIFVDDKSIFNNDSLIRNILSIQYNCEDNLIIGSIGFIDSQDRLHAKVLFSDYTIQNIDLISKVGGDLEFYFNDELSTEIEDYKSRTKQAYGLYTTNLLSKLTIGIVGVSGTGSPTIEMLHRLGVGKLVICDSDIVEHVNLNRILYSTTEDVEKKRFKVEVMTDAIRNCGLNTIIVPLTSNCISEPVLRELTQCDVIFGCVDSIQARDFLNRISIFYTIPYFDLGVKLVADGTGGISHVCGSVHYLKPDGPSLLTRGVFNLEALSSESMRNSNPIEYENQVKEKYIIGVNVESPAVISINMLISSLGVNDFLARVHPHRNHSNEDISVITADLNEVRLIAENNFPVCKVYAKYLGRGNCIPLLNMPELE
ncbi:MAG: ThiF family adenylyltransferase [Bacillota bacterium]|nr:ThiF family adenylyltransferase [Bacillota bacterium]